MKLLYIAFTDMSDEAFGAVKKIQDHITAFTERGFDVTLAARRGADVFAGEETIGKYSPKTKNAALLSVINKRNQLKALIRYAEKNAFDCCYIRYDLASPLFIRLLKRLKCKILLEIPTYPYKKEYGHSPAYFPKLAADFIWRGRMKKYVGRAITFYPAETIFGIPAIVTPNGIDFRRLSPVKTEVHADELHVLAAASMRKWHGYERFIEGMGKYYGGGGKERIILHLAGEGRELKKYARLAKKLNLGARIIFEGKKSGRELEELLELCPIAIDSLARHRSGIEALSSLKSREYGAAGLPFISSCAVDVIGEDFPYMLRVPADESPIDMEAVLDFYKKIRLEPRAETAKKIRAYMEERTDVRRVMAAAAEYFEKEGRR